MNLNEYQMGIKKFAIYPKNEELTYLALGLTSEAGEFAGKIKKKIRDGDFLFDEDKATQELGDVLWYLTMLASHFHTTLADLASKNYDKLSHRQAQGTITGSGDSR